MASVRCRTCGSELPPRSVDGVGGECPRCGSLPQDPPSHDSTATLRLDTPSVAYLPDEVAPPAPIHAGESMGPVASLTTAGIIGGVSLEPAPTSSKPTDQGESIAVPGFGDEPDPGTTTSLQQALQAPTGSEKYVITGEVARGGMGAILKAADRDVRREVAMKVLLRDDSPRARERFVEEAQITGQLEHPNIVPVHDLGVDSSGRLFFTMKLVRGQSLAQVLQALRQPGGSGSETPPFTLQQLLRRYLMVLNAVAFAHDRDVVHRDLKPSNIMLGDFGEVLVMDWGLAKVIRGERQEARFVGQTTTAALARHTAPLDLGRQDRGTRAADEKFATMIEALRTRALGDDEHVIEGTPAYMPPEQARGELDAIDERSDIYALGAILYEILTLVPPVRVRSLKATLQDVVAGRILPPGERAPDRAIPSELEAIAMKALARRKEDRYQQVVDLRRDIDLFLEGRSVSAKEDSPFEAVVKLVRRNAQVVLSIAVAAVIVILVTALSFRAVLRERQRFQDLAANAESTLHALRLEQANRLTEQRLSAPALLAKARRAAERKEFADARQDLDLALTYNPDLAEGHMLRAQLLVRDQDFEGAGRELLRYLASAPDDPDARRLAELCAQAQAQGGAGPGSVLATAIADVFSRQGAFSFAESLYAQGRALVAVYRKRLENAWPRCTRSGFSMDAEGRVRLEGLAGRSDVMDLEPLAGMPISRLDLSRTRVVDLSPLKGMPLVWLDLAGTQVRNLEPLVGIGITRLNLAGTPMEDLGPLSHMPLDELDLTGTKAVDLGPLANSPLQSLDLTGTPVDNLESLKELPLTTLSLNSTRVSDLAPLAGMPLNELDLTGTPVSDLHPLKGSALSVLRLAGTKVHDLGPLAGQKLTILTLDRTRVSELGPLKGMPLRSISIVGTAVADLSPLRGCALVSLDLSGLTVSDLAPLASLPLASLNLSRTSVSNLQSLAPLRLSSLSLADTRVGDLTPLKGMPLTSLDLSRCPVTNLQPLRGCPLASLVLDGTPVEDLQPLRHLPLKELRLAGTQVRDLSPLAALALERLVLPPGPLAKGLPEIRSMASLRQIGRQWDGSWARVPAAAEFWRRWDEGQRAEW